MVQASETVAAAGAEVERLRKTRDVDWPSVLFFIHVHLLSLYGLWLLFFEAKLLTLLFLVVLSLLGILGVTTGAHRLWAHRSYKGSTGLRVTLMLWQTLAGQGPIYDWVQYHRLHHAHFGDLGDPYDHNKGIVYSHVLARLWKLSPHQVELKDSIDMSDLEQDPIVMFQKQFYWALYGVLFLLLPLNAPLEYWGESVVATVFIIGMLRYMVLLHATWLLESGMGVWGLEPGQKYPHDSNSVFILSKTFWPHYHYLIPYDYKSGEYGTYDSGCSTAFIRVYAALGLASELRTVETATVQRALAAAAKSGRPTALKECLDEAVAIQTLPADHYLKRSS